MPSFFSKWKKDNKNQPEKVQENANHPRESAPPFKEDVDLKNPENALDFLLDSLHGNLGSTDRVEGKQLVLSQWQMTIRPEVSQMTENSAILNFYLSSPKWDREVFECSVGTGSNPHQALGMATGSFLFSFMHGINLMETEQNGEALETVFAGKPHRWKAYVSDVVGMGESPKMDSPKLYWNALKEHIIKRLGNQKLCYVKIYGAKTNGQITGECRINDIVSPELSDMVAKMVEKWNVKSFASHKQFIFICQGQETILPNPYSGTEGLKLLKSKVKIAAEMFHGSTTQELYDSLTQRMTQALGDSTLAAECYSFLPEICAENAFPQIICEESVEIRVGDKPPVTCYKEQLSDYWNLHKALFDLFQEGVFGEETNAIYQEYIGVSSIFGAVKQMEEKQVNSGSIKLTVMLFQMGDDFEIR